MKTQLSCSDFNDDIGIKYSSSCWFGDLDSSGRLSWSNQAVYDQTLNYF